MSDIDPWQRLRARIAILELTNNDLRAEVERLRAALDRLARLGNEPDYGNSVGNEIARDALKEGGR
jgi:hypothetical protein